MAKTTAPENRSSYKSQAYLGMVEAWEITRSLWEGALSLRNKGSHYLLQFPREDNNAYQERKKWWSVFYDQFKRTIKGFTGLVFDDNPSPLEAPQPLMDLFSDIDCCGNDFYTFLLTSFEKFLRDGNGFFLATSPALTDTQKEILKVKGSLDMADRLDDRPYGIFFTAAQCINHFYENVDGREVLSQITIEEKTYERNGVFGEKEVIRHRIYRRGSLEVRKFESMEDLNDDIYSIETQVEFAYRDIMLVPITEIGSEPPFLSIALLNILHYNKTSDFDNWCHKANVPTPIFQMDSEDDAKKFNESFTKSPNTAITGWGQHFKAFFLEVAGTSADVTMNRIKEVEEQISKLGLEKLAPVKDNTRKTATEINSDNIQSHSELVMLVRQFENAVEKFMYFLGVLLNDIKPNTVDLENVAVGKIKLNINYKKLTFPLADLDRIRSLVTDRILSIETLIEMLPQLLETLPEDWTKEIELARLEKEKPIVIEQPKIPV